MVVGIDIWEIKLTGSGMFVENDAQRSDRLGRVWALEGEIPWNLGAAIVKQYPYGMTHRRQFKEESHLHTV